MSAFSIESCATHAEPKADPETGKLVQWCEIVLLVPKDFDFSKSAKLVKQLEFCVSLIGRTDA